MNYLVLAIIGVVLLSGCVAQEEPKPPAGEEPLWYQQAVADCQARDGNLVAEPGFSFQCNWLATSAVGAPQPCRYAVDEEGQVTVFEDPEIFPECKLGAPLSYVPTLLPPEPTPEIPPPPVDFFIPKLPEAKVGEPYNNDRGIWFCEPPGARSGLHCGGLIEVNTTNPTGGKQPYTFSASGLPLGLKMDSNGWLHGMLPEGFTVIGESDEREIEICVKDSALFQTCKSTILPIVAAGCPSPYDGDWSGSFSLTDRRYPLYGEYTDAYYYDLSEVSFTATLTLVCNPKTTYTAADGGEQFVLDVTNFQSSLAVFGCQGGCRPEESLLAVLLPPLGSDRQPQYIRIELPVGIRLVLTDLEVSADGRQISAAGEKVLRHIGEPRCLVGTGRSCQPSHGEFTLTKRD